jgi:hypothetical protein
VAQRRIHFDKTEIVVGFVAGKKYVTMNLTYEDVVRIQFDPVREFRWFRPVASEQISIVTGRREAPIVYRMLENRRYWAEYKAGLAKFAAANHITFADRAGSTEP